MTTRRFPMQPYPTSWYRIAQSGDVGVGELKTVHYFGRDLVLHRTRDGRPRVFDAHCPHLGAHFGHGGRLDGDDLVCPFHAWRFDPEGRCVEIPYAEGRIPERARALTYPAADLNGVVMIFWDDAGRTPDWTVPALPEYDDTEIWTERTWKTWRIRTHVQEVFENGPDAVHQRALHCALEWPQDAVTEQHDQVFQGRWSGKYDAGEGLPVAVADQSTVFTDYGLGFTHLDLTIDYDGFKIDRQIQFCITPIDEEYVDATLSTRGRRVGDPDIDKTIDESIAFHTWRSFDEDVPIWEHKIYRSLPAQNLPDRGVESAVFVEADRDIARFRAWARQFYPEDSGV